MSELKMTNIPSMPVGKLIDILTDMYAAVIGKGPMSALPSVMLWGPPGVGKSQAVREVAERLAERTKKRVSVTDVRLLLFNPIDLRGIPTANAEKTLAVWLKPKIFDMDGGDDVINFLFLDEITAAPQSVQAAAYQITLDRVVGEHRLPDNCIVIAAGNRMTDKSVTYRMPKALANRLMHFEAEGSFDSWREWAVGKGIHPKVLGFLAFRRDLLMAFDPATEDVAFPTPRAWERVSDILNRVGDDLEEVYPYIAGLVGTGAAIELRTWEKVYRTLPSVEDIFRGKMPPVPKGTDALYALVASMTAYAREHRGELDLIANSIVYAEKLPPDFSVVLLKDYMALEKGYLEKLMKIPAFLRWLSAKGSLLNGTFR